MQIINKMVWRYKSIFFTMGHEDWVPKTRKSRGKWHSGRKASLRVSIADRKFFACFEIFCACPQNWLKIKSKQSISLGSFWTVWKYAIQSGKFLDSLESYQRVWKFFRTVWKAIHVFLAYISQKQYTRFIPKVFADKSLLTKKTFLGLWLMTFAWSRLTCLRLPAHCLI